MAMKSVKVFILFISRPAFVPRLAHVSAPANVRVGEYKSTVKQTQPVGIESHGEGISVGAIAVDIERVLCPPPFLSLR